MPMSRILVRCLHCIDGRFLNWAAVTALINCVDPEWGVAQIKIPFNAVALWIFSFHSLTKASFRRFWKQIILLNFRPKGF